MDCWHSVVRPNLSSLLDKWRPDLRDHELLIMRQLVSREEYRSLSCFRRSEQHEKLLSEVLPKKGVVCYDKFCVMLSVTGRQDIVELLCHLQNITLDEASEKETKLSEALSERRDSLMKFQLFDMTLAFKKAQTVQEDIGEAGGIIRSEFFRVTIPPGAIKGKALCTGFTVYEYQSEQSEGVEDDTDVTDIILLHPCGAKFSKHAEIRIAHTVPEQRETRLLYKGPDAGEFSVTQCELYTQTSVTNEVGMTATLCLPFIDIRTTHFCKLFACLFGCAGHCYRALAFGRWKRGASPRTATIDLHFTSPKTSYVSVVERCHKGLPQLLNCNATVFFSRHDPITLEITNVSPGWKLISTPSAREIQKQELTQAKKCPSKYCTRHFMLRKEDNDADDPWLEVQLTGGKKTNCFLMLKEYASSSVASSGGAADVSSSGETTLSSRVTDDHIRDLHLKVRVFWKEVANFLGPLYLTDDEIRLIARSREFDNDGDRCKEMLRKWRMKQTSGTVSDVLKALLHNDIGLLSVAKEVFGKAAVDYYHSKIFC